MNVSIFTQMHYENLSDWTLGENKPNTKPIQTQSNPILSAVGGLQMSVNSILTKDYERNDIFAVPENKPNSNPIQTQFSPVSLLKTDLGQYYYQDFKKAVIFCMEGLLFFL